ncbi:hypothetical protein RASY3_11745 [Ruminococcus albus SY3]|uniref:Uncharacterized protein n=1 Tax=Ruminococcus albus SY3 TaxID=1341156 RepID=A0A011WQ75_RUMAL|nr:hypothetical protein RASY3_11745 [Ruminococcus albus SY3]
MSIVKMLNHGVRQRWLFIKYLTVRYKKTLFIYKMFQTLRNLRKVIVNFSRFVSLYIEIKKHKNTIYGNENVFWK